MTPLPRNSYKTKEEERAALIEEMLSLSSAMVEALRYGNNQKAAHKVCSMLLPYTNADAISITDKEQVLAYVGFLEEDYSHGKKIKTKVTHEVLRTGKSKTVLNEDEIGFPEARHKINAAIVEPLVVARDTIGVMKFYFKSSTQVTKSQRVIAHGFSKLMSTQIAALETEYQRELNALMEVKMLQSQINPHFLFNTINTISSLTRTDPDRAREMLRNFAGFYRATLQQDSEMITLHDELENTRKYAILQQMRFGEDRLSFEVNVRRDYQDTFSIPPFVFQPVVENSILHGMPNKGTLHIRIEGEKEGRSFILIISDDGKGMDDETLKKMFKQAPRDTEGLGLAMSNVYSRIKGCFGKRANMLVESELGRGTKTTFILPFACDPS